MAREANLYCARWEDGYDIVTAKLKLLEWSQLNPTLVAVLNMSLGVQDRINCSDTQALAISGVIQVFAAGNSGSDARTLRPAGCRWAMVVGNSNSLVSNPDLVDRPNSGSSWGVRLDLWAPG